MQNFFTIFLLPTPIIQRKPLKPSKRFQIQMKPQKTQKIFRNTGEFLLFNANQPTEKWIAFLIWTKVQKEENVSSWIV